MYLVFAFSLRAKHTRNCHQILQDLRDVWHNHCRLYHPSVSYVTGRSLHSYGFCILPNITTYQKLYVTILQDLRDALTSDVDE